MMLESLVLLTATGFGLGWLPLAPGTFGSLIGLPLAWWLVGQRASHQAVVIALMLIVALPLCHWASIWLDSGDASQIVADEYLAFPVAVAGLVVARRPWVIGIAFLLFRFFDISKLPPIHHAELIGGGPGMVMDDIGAAIYTWATMILVLALWRWRRSFPGF